MSHEFWMGCFVASSTAMLLLQKVASQTEMRRFSLLLVQAAFLAPALGLSAKAGIFQVKPLERRMLFIFLLPSALFLLLLISEPNVTVPALLAARSLGLCLVASGEYLFFHQGKTLCQKWGMALVLCGAGCGLQDLPLEFSLWLVLNSLIHVGFQLLEKPAICATAQTPEGLAIIQNFYVLAMGSLLFLAAERPGRPVIKAPLPWELVLVLSAAAGLVLNLSYVKVNLCFQVTSIAMAEVLSLVFVSLLGSLCFWREDTMSPGHFVGAMLSLLGASIYAEPLDFLRRRRSRFRCLDLAGLCLVLAVLHGAAQQTLRCSQSVSHMSEETLSRCLRISVLVQEHRRRGLAQDRDNSTQFVPDTCPSLLPEFSFSTPLDDGFPSCGIAVVSALFGGYDEFDFRSPSFEDPMFCFFLFLDRLSAKMAPTGTGQTGSWNLVVLAPDQVPGSATPAQSSRIPKMLSHRAFGKARFLLYMDSKKNVWPWVTADSLASWVLLQIRPYPASTPYAWVGAEHPDRFTAYEEALEVCFRGVAGEQCVEQMMGYHRRGFPIDFGIPLLEGGWHLRDLRRPESSEVGCHWMQEFLSWDQPRDQLSWNFAVWSSRLAHAVHLVEDTLPATGREHVKPRPKVTQSSRCAELLPLAPGCQGRPNCCPSCPNRSA